MFFKEILSDRKFVVTGGALFFSLLLFIFFPSTERLSAGTQSLIALFIFFLVFPLLYVRLILGESWRRMGFQVRNELADWLRVCGAVVLGFTLFLFAYQAWGGLREAYQLPFSVERSFLSFVQYEFFMLMTAFFYEVFFRGLVMLVFLRRFGAFAIVLQSLVFLLFLLASQSFGMNQTAMILFAPLAGWVAYRSQSLGYSFLASGLFLMAIDVFLLLVNRQ